MKDVQQYEEPKQEQEDEKLIPFWYNDPNIIFHSKYIYEIYPNEEMTYNQMLNAVTRSVLLLSIIIFLSFHYCTYLHIDIVIIIVYVSHDVNI